MNQSQENLRGILMMVTAMALFAVEDMFIKWAAFGVPTGQIILISGAFGVPVFAIMARRQGQKVWTREALHPAVLARNLGEMVGTVGYVTALASVPLSTVSAVLQAMPLAVTMAAALFLQEKVGWRRWSAIAVGFSGVILVIRPGMEGFRSEALWVVLTVFGLTLRDIAARRIPKDCTTAQVSAWGLMSVALVGALMMASTAEAVVPTLWQCSVLFGALVFGCYGYWAIISATRVGEISIVAPFRYTRLIFALIIGTLVFHERPDGATLIGAALIIGSGLYSFARERRRNQALPMSVLAG